MPKYFGTNFCPHSQGKCVPGYTVSLVKRQLLSTNTLALLDNLQRPGQFIIFASDHPPKVFGSRRQNYSVYHSPAKFEAL